MAVSLAIGKQKLSKLHEERKTGLVVEEEEEERARKVKLERGEKGENGREIVGLGGDVEKEKV